MVLRDPCSPQRHTHVQFSTVRYSACCPQMLFWLSQWPNKTNNTWCLDPCSPQRHTTLHTVSSISISRSHFIGLLQHYSVLQSTTPVLLCTTQCYSSTTLYYKVLLQYYSVLQSTTPVLLCTTQYYSSTTLYYTILLQYYSVLQSTTPVLLSTTQYYSSTSLYYEVLLQYYSLLQSTTPVLLQYYSVLLMIDPRNSRDVSTTSPNTAPATKSNTHHWSSSHMKRYFQ